MRIICYYGIYGEEIAETEIEKLFFTSVKKSIDASVTNIKNGKKSGAGNTSTTRKSDTVHNTQVAQLIKNSPALQETPVYS